MEMSASGLLEIVAGHPFLSGLDRDYTQVLTQCAMLTRFEANQIIFREGDIANLFYLIQQGKVCLETHSKLAHAIKLQTIGAGDVLGWSWLFPPYYWHFSACALEPTQAVFFYGTRLRECCEDDPKLGYQLMKRVAGILIRRLEVTQREA